MSADRPSSGPRLARRRFLGALAAAPAALAGCAAAGEARGGKSPPAPSGTVAPARSPAPDAATRAVRDQQLPAGAEPAFVFRAGSARPGEP